MKHALTACSLILIGMCTTVSTQAASRFGSKWAASSATLRQTAISMRPPAPSKRQRPFAALQPAAELARRSRPASLQHNFMQAILKNDVSTVCNLLAQNQEAEADGAAPAVDVNQRDDRGYSPLALALAMQLRSLALILHGNGALLDLSHPIDNQSAALTRRTIAAAHSADSQLLTALDAMAHTPAAREPLDEE